MVAHELQKVLNKYEDTFIDKPEFTIRFVKDHDELLVVAGDLSQDDLSKLMSVLSRYITALIDKQKFKTAFDDASFILPDIEKNFTALRLDKNSSSWYKALKFQMGRAAYELKHYKLALKHFNYLLKDSPDDLTLNRWRFYAQAHCSKLYYNVALGAAVVLVIGDLTLRHYLPSWLRMSVNTLIIGLAMYTWILWYNHQRAKKRYMV
jgi:tetratricopeptide (TPR) repeat protein